MDAPPPKRDSIISAANLLMVALLKLNRVLVPALLRWLRSRRLEWVRRSCQDVAKQLNEGTAPTRLCVGSCCRDLSYGTFPTTDAWAENTGPDAAPPHDETNLTEPPHVQLPNPNKTRLDEDDRRFRLLVAQEERHRANRMLPFVYTSVMSVYFTVGTLLLYSAIIISIVLTMFPFESWEAVVFSFSLVATATISESETLMQSRRKRTATGARLADPATSRPINVTEQIARVGGAGATNVAADTGVGEAAGGSKAPDEIGGAPGSGVQRPEGVAPLLSVRTGAHAVAVPAGAPLVPVVEAEDFSDLEK